MNILGSGVQIRGLSCRPTFGLMSILVIKSQKWVHLPGEIGGPVEVRGMVRDTGKTDCKTIEPMKRACQLPGAQTFRGDQRDKDGKPPGGGDKGQEGHW